MRVLTPAERPPRPWPRWALAALGLCLVLGALSKLSAALELFGDLALLSGCVGAFALLTRAEERVFAELSRRAVALRLVTTLALGPLGLVVLPIAGVLASGLPDALGFVDGLIPLGFVSGLWWFGACAGSTPIVLIDAAISAIVPGFRRRVQLAVLALLLLIAVLSGAVAAGAMEILASLRLDPRVLDPRITINGERMPLEQIQQEAQRLLEHPGLVVLGALGVALLLGLPALWSATGKLADAVMERIHPLSMAFDLVAKGERGIAVEEGGSRELSEMTARFNAMVSALGLAERMERAFGVYVSPQVLARIREQHGDAALPPSLRDASVFFADIRGFTSMSERLSPAQVVGLLNRYFARVVPVIEAHGGYLNKFVGDAVVVVWNGPVDQADHAERATRCALALQVEVAAMNAEGQFPELAEGDQPGVLKVGVGVATGPMICGNVGSARQMEYTVIGDTVNLSARLTGQAKAGEVVVSERTARADEAAIACEALEPIKLKGKELPVTPYRAIAGGARGSG